VIRGVLGVACLVAGVVLWFVAWPEGVYLRWILRIGLPLAGAFSLYEARRSWCALRDLGIKTPV
jgi:hypothetical protein